MSTACAARGLGHQTVGRIREKLILQMENKGCATGGQWRSRATRAQTRYQARQKGGPGDDKPAFLARLDVPSRSFCVSTSRARDGRPRTASPAIAALLCICIIRFSRCPEQGPQVFDQAYNQIGK